MQKASNPPLVALLLAAAAAPAKRTSMDSTLAGWMHARSTQSYFDSIKCVLKTMCALLFCKRQRRERNLRCPPTP